MTPFERMMKTEKMGRVYRRHAKSSPCRGKSARSCKGKTCKLAKGKKRRFCRRKTNTRHH